MDDLEFLRCPACGGKTRDKVRRDTYIIVLNETDILAVTVRNTYYAEYGDPVVPDADAVL